MITTAVSQQEVETAVVAAIARALDAPAERIDLDASLLDDYGAESLDLLEIVFALEKAFHIRLPKSNLMQHAQEHFGEEKFVHQGELTDFALRALRALRPEIDPAVVKPGLRVHEVARLMTPRTFVRLSMRLLQANEEALDKLRDGGCVCGSAEIDYAPSAPEFLCASCNAVYPTPDGDEVLLRDLDALELDHDD